MAAMRLSRVKTVLEFLTLHWFMSVVDKILIKNLLHTIDNEIEIKINIEIVIVMSVQLKHFTTCLDIRAWPDWAYEFAERTGRDTQICRTGPARPDWIRTYIFKHSTCQVQFINSQMIRSLDTNLVSKVLRPNK